MATLHRTAKLSPLPRGSRANSPWLGASYADSATEMQLRQALAQAEALLREKDRQIQAVLVWRESAANHLAGLTRRQRQIMELVLAGEASKNIAADLGISQRTVENHRAAIMKRTGSTCLPALARMALAAAWGETTVSPPSAESWSTGGPGYAPIAQAPADWRGGSAAWRGAPGRAAANQWWSSNNGVVAFPGSPMPAGRQGASVANLPTPVQRRSK